MSEEKKGRKRATNWRWIARVFLFIVGFNIVVRSDMWVSLCILVMVCIQLFPLLWVKKIRGYFSEENRRVIADKVKAVMRRWYAKRGNAQALENTPSFCVNIIVEPVTRHHQADKYPPSGGKAAAIPAPDDMSDDARFEDVWRDSDVE